MGRSLDALRLDVRELRPGVPVRDGELEILPVRASHAPKECALNFLLSGRDESRILIANDTGWWPEESWELLRGRRLDVAVIEISMGIRMPYAEERGFHLGAKAADRFPRPAGGTRRGDRFHAGRRDPYQPPCRSDP